MCNPSVTILLTTFNRAHLIGETLDSIRAQTYTNWNCIIVDDNSTDNTENFLKENYLIKDNRFSYYKKDLTKYTQGLASSRNMSLDLAKEKNREYIQFFDDDDLMHEQKLALQMNLFIIDKSLSFVTCEYEHLNTDSIDLKKLRRNNLPIKSDDLLFDFMSTNQKVFLNSCGPIWKTSIWKGTRFDERLKTAEEFDVYCRLFIRLGKVNYSYVPNLLFFYRKHNNSNTVNRYQTKAFLESVNLAYLNIFNDLIKYDRMNEKYFSFFVKRFIFISFNHEWEKKINYYLQKQKGYYTIKFLKFTFLSMRKLIIKMI